MTPFPALANVTQRGFSLIVALMMLIVIIILGISASQMAINEERGARNERDRQIAFQAAEAALQDAEAEILSPSSPACAIAGQHGNGRLGTQKICFNHSSGVFFAVNCASSPAQAVGLCAYDDTSPAYLSTNVNFFGDASGSGGNGNTVKYGTFTLKTFPSQETAGTGTPISRYPPRYIIEAVPQNVAPAQSCTGSGGATGCGVMFRVTAMGFGANPNAQVVLQTVVSTED